MQQQSLLSQLRQRQLPRVEWVFAVLWSDLDHCSQNIRSINLMSTSHAAGFSAGADVIHSVMQKPLTQTPACEQGCTFSPTHSSCQQVNGRHLTVKPRWIAVDSRQETSNCWLFLFWGFFFLNTSALQGNPESGGVEWISMCARLANWIGRSKIHSWSQPLTLF